MGGVLLQIMMVLLMVCAGACALYWGAVAMHVRLTRRGLPTARDGIAMADREPPTQRVCVVVPCHNEAGNIATLIASLREQDYDRLRVVLALDRCTDDTIGVARQAIGDDPRFEIIEVTSCPQEWAGKVHAAYIGCERSVHAHKADVLVFTDADTWMDPSCLRACIALMNERGLDFLSLLSTLSTNAWYERVVQPITAFELARQYPLLRVNRRDSHKRAFANGQFMMFDREAYLAVGGHEGVKDAILEDIAFARKIAYAGRHGGLLMADNMLKCRMYDSWEEYTRGWKRIYTESANREVKRLRRYGIRVPILAAWLPLCCAALIVLSFFVTDDWAYWTGVLLGIVGLVAWWVGLGAVYRMSHAPLRDVPLVLVGSVLTGRIFRAAARDLKRGTPTSWGGRSYVRRAEG